MRGETVTVGTTDVGNVLVYPGDARVPEERTLPMGETVAYTLCFPIGYEGEVHAGTSINVRGHACRSTGFSDHVRPREVFGSWGGDWDMVVAVELVSGDMSAEITVYALSVTRDSLGLPTTSTTEVWTGDAQARMLDGSEATGEANLTDARERWAFVAPWQDAFASMRPEHTVIAYKGARYDVTSIEDVDEKGLFASFEAVRHGE